jgi:flagellar L-ring protein precursor FlgH
MKKIYKIIIIAPFVLLLFGGCGPKKIKFDKPRMQIPKPEKEVKRKNGSLYSMQGSSLFADKKDLQIGDILKVIITEDLTNTTSSKRDTSKKTAGSYDGGMRTKVDEKGKKNNIVGFGLNTNTNSTFKGSAKASITDTFETELSVIIEETYKNGNYYIKGSKQMLIDEQMQEIVLSGVIRPYDIGADNTIESTKIANLKIYYKREGEEVDATHKSWGTKFIEAIWPF